MSMPELEKCASPVCDVRFEPSGLAMEPKRYCSDGCKMDVFAIRRVARAYGLDAETVHEALSKIKRWVSR
jgi:hypothetical protein